MHARWLNAAGLLIIGLLGIGAVVSSGAIAETKHAKPPPKRAVVHPRVAPRSFAIQRRGLPNQQQNVGNRFRQGNFVRPGIGSAVGTRGNGTGLRAFGPGTRNPTAALGNGRNMGALGGRNAAFANGRNPGAIGARGQFGNLGNRAGFGAGRFGAQGRFANFGNRGAFGARGRQFGALSRNGNVSGLGNRLRGGNGAPPGTRLIDMRVMPLPPGTGLPPVGETRFATRQVVLQFGADVTPQQVTATAQRFNLTVVSQQNVGALRRTLYTFRINNNQSVPDVIREVQGAGLNAAAQPDYTYSLMQDRDSTVADRGDPAQYIVQKFDLAAVHRITEGNDVVIALIDSRVDLKQPDFADRIVDNYDAGCGPNAPPDTHGTGMAGAIASHIGLLGIAPNAKIMAICAFGGIGASAEATSANIIRGLDYAIQHNAKIVNMSFAGPQDPALAQELQVAREKGILIIAAAGNAGPQSPPLYPGADPNVLAVTATDAHDRLFTGANQGDYIAVAAPGVNVLVPAPHADVQYTTGTSVASANVSGVAALLLAVEPTRTPEDIRDLLVQTAKHLGSDGTNPQFGAGLVDPLKALSAAPEVASQKTTPAADTPRVLVAH
jgi:hypothetical protein